MKEILKQFSQGQMVILVDDESRENEGDLVIAAEKITPQSINFMATFGRGLICLSLTEERCRHLGLSQMVERNTSSLQTAFTQSIEARQGVTTGISAKDRATTILTAIREGATADDLVSPGHIFPLIAKEGGVLVRGGQTEGSVDLARLAGLLPAAVICEVMNEDGTMARMPDLKVFSERHQIPIVSIEEMIKYRLKNEILVTQVAEQDIKVFNGEIFKRITFRNELDQNFHVALTLGEMAGESPVAVRVHVECFLSDVFGDKSCGCGARLHRAIQIITEKKRGVLIYLKKSAEELKKDANFTCVSSNREPDPVHNSYIPDFREIGVGAQILRHLGIKNLDLLSSNPQKFVGLDGYGIQIHQRIPLLHMAGETARQDPKIEKNGTHK